MEIFLFLFVVGVGRTAFLLYGSVERHEDKPGAYTMIFEHPDGFIDQFFIQRRHERNLLLEQVVLIGEASWQNPALFFVKAKRQDTLWNHSYIKPWFRGSIPHFSFV